MKISIITVVLNSKPYIEECINSVLNQTESNVEYIVIDGGSTDGTVATINQYGQKITKWVSESDRGIYDAMNKGIKLATGDVIGFLNADDIYSDKEALEKVVSVMTSSSADACYSDLAYVDKNDLSKIIRYWRSGRFEPGLFKKGWVPPHPTFFVRKEVYDSYGVFDLKYRLAADFELMARFLERHGIETAYIPGVLVKMRTGGATNKSLSNIVKQNFEILDACRKNEIEISPLSFLANKIVKRLGQFWIRNSI